MHVGSLLLIILILQILPESSPFPSPSITTDFFGRRNNHVTSASSQQQQRSSSPLYLSKRNKKKNDNSVAALIHSHHLLDHKPDDMIVKGGRKFKLRGAGCLGRPGVALCIGPSQNIDKFLAKLKSTMPQKKFGQNIIDISHVSDEELDTILSGDDNEFKSVTQGELRQLLAALGHEDQFFALTGIDPSIATTISPSPTDGGNGGGKKPKGKKRKKK